MDLDSINSAIDSLTLELVIDEQSMSTSTNNLLMALRETHSTLTRTKLNSMHESISAIIEPYTTPSSSNTSNGLKHLHKELAALAKLDTITNIVDVDTGSPPSSPRPRSYTRSKDVRTKLADRVDLSTPDIIALSNFQTKNPLQQFVETKKEHLLSQIKQIQEPALKKGEKMRGSMLLDILAQWEMHYTKTINIVLADLKATSNEILLLSSPCLDLDYDVTAHLTFSRSMRSDRSERGSRGNSLFDAFAHGDASTIQIHNNNDNQKLLVLLSQSYCKIIAQQTEKCIKKIIDQNKNSTSAFSQRTYESSRWNIFSNMCTEAKEVPGKVIDALFLSNKGYEKDINFIVTDLKREVSEESEPKL
tara:strand:+ start:333 stop:1418 length:1086 start_codon:yes stop_codon:yes gene_type:complete